MFDRFTQFGDLNLNHMTSANKMISFPGPVDEVGLEVTVN